MSVRHETKIEFALDEALELPEANFDAELKAAVVQKCRAAYGAAEDISEDNFEQAKVAVAEANKLLQDAAALLVGDEYTVRSLRRRIAVAQEALADFLRDFKSTL
jgi:hypothetical protein